MTDTRDSSDVLAENMIKLVAMIDEMNRRLIVERDMVQLLFALGAANGWNVREALERISPEMAKLSDGGNGQQVKMGEAYITRINELLSAAGAKRAG
ncbi:MAG: hypothetical protein EOP19_13205 [Hyphomicrobiales bacterium]|nr:MAG: hypothetical protein EOP19_13205 [Hyphomicrobiales bacterium]